MLVAIKFPANDDHKIIKRIMNQFGSNAAIAKIAQYAEDEYFIPFNKAVKLIHESTTNL